MWGLLKLLSGYGKHNGYESVLTQEEWLLMGLAYCDEVIVQVHKLQ
jgi:hypothetical protein